VASGLPFFLLAMAAGLAMASLFIYVGSAPAIIIQQWGLAETQFHYIFIPIVAGFMVASFISGRIAGSVARRRQLNIGFAVLCLSGVMGALSHLLFADVPILIVQIQWFFMAAGAQLNFPVLSLEMIDMHPAARGAAASVQTFVALGIGALVMGMVAPLMQGDLQLLAWVSLAASLCGWLAWRAGVALRKVPGREHFRQ
jgi:DHA1 family bicyclomycin/chloramphenicol resistance-like MFS transporter